LPGSIRSVILGVLPFFHQYRLHLFHALMRQISYLIPSNSGYPKFPEEFSARSPQLLLVMGDYFD